MYRINTVKNMIINTISLFQCDCKVCKCTFYTTELKFVELCEKCRQIDYNWKND